MEGEGGSEGERHADDGHGHGGVGLYMEDTRWVLMYGAWSRRFGYDEGRRRDMSVDQCACVSHINITQLPDKRAMHGTGRLEQPWHHDPLIGMKESASGVWVMCSNGKRQSTAGLSSMTDRYPLSSRNLW